MSPHMTGSDALILVILLVAPLAFGLCGALSIIAMLFRGRVSRIAQRLAIVGLILVHAGMLAAASDEWADVMLMRDRAPFFQLIPIGHVLVLAGYLVLRARKHTTDS